MQHKPEFLDQLIDLASKKAGSDYKLAQMLHSPRQVISQWRHGVRTCPAADVALMAQIAGLDPDAWVSRAVISQYEGTEKGEALKIALKKALLATGAVLATSGAIACECGSHLIRCIKGIGKAKPIGFNYGKWFA